MDLEDRLYSSTEVADILGVSLRSVYRYLEDGDLKAEVKTATGRHRFTRQDILNFLYPDSAKASTQNVPILKTTSRPVRAKNTPRAVPTTSKEPTKEELAEETDWLERFRAARKAMAQGEPTQQEGSGLPPTVPEGASSPIGVGIAPLPAVDPVDPTNVRTNIDQANVEPVDDLSAANPVENDDEDVDWLAKFRAARESISKAQTAPAPVPAQPTPVPTPTPAENLQPVTSNVTPVQDTVVAPEPPSTVESSPVDTIGPAGMADKIPEPQADLSTGFFYYRSSTIPQLKELAHSLNKSAGTSSIPYAFTLNAGMSLYKSIKPFSVLHVYVKPEHKVFFEKALSLVKADKNAAQLCLIATNDSFIFDTSKDMHGLKVVSTVRLKKDLLDGGEEQYASELDLVQS